MQVSPYAIKSVAFLARKSKDGRHILKGTAFFAGVPSSIKGRSFTFVVTARHVIEAISASSHDATSYLRLNLKDRGALWLTHKLDQWVFAEDDRVDVAFALVGWDAAWDHMWLDPDLYVTEEHVKSGELQTGNALYFPGLFVHHAGDTQNIPIVRVGNLSAMPHGRVRTKRGPIECYLVEARSIGGLSGSPVFVQLSSGKFRFLGLVHGHFGVEDCPDEAVEDVLPLDREERSVNMGIGMVIPASNIKAAIMQPMIAAMMKSVEAQLESALLQTTPTEPSP